MYAHTSLCFWSSSFCFCLNSERLLRNICTGTIGNLKLLSLCKVYTCDGWGSNYYVFCSWAQLTVLVPRILKAGNSYNRIESAYWKKKGVELSIILTLVQNIKQTRHGAEVVRVNSSQDSRPNTKTIRQNKRRDRWGLRARTNSRDRKATVTASTFFYNKQENEWEGKIHGGVWNGFVHWDSLFEKGFRCFRVKVLQIVGQSRAPKTFPWNYEAYETRVQVTIPAPPKQQGGGQRIPLTPARIMHQFVSHVDGASVRVRSRVRYSERRLRHSTSASVGQRHSG